jgi:hypothetical protein
MDEIAEFGNRWSGWAKIIGTVVALLAVLGVGSFFYNEVWQKKSLTYTILPSYDLGEQAFSGLVIENRGRVPLTDVQIIITDLDAPIQVLRMPGAHEPANIVEGGEGHDKVRIELPRFSKGSSLPVYLVTNSAPRIEPGANFLVTSAEAVGEPSTEAADSLVNYLVMLVVSLIAMWFIMTVAENIVRLRTFRARSPARERSLQHTED